MDSTKICEFIAEMEEAVRQCIGGAPGTVHDPMIQMTHG
jgi:hypothetical protein